MEQVRVYHNKIIYRPAGTRIPKIGELYVSKTGKLSTCTEGSIPPEARLILRQLESS